MDTKWAVLLLQKRAVLSLQKRAVLSLQKMDSSIAEKKGNFIDGYLFRCNIGCFIAAKMQFYFMGSITVTKSAVLCVRFYGCRNGQFYH